MDAQTVQAVVTEPTQKSRRKSPPPGPGRPKGSKNKKAQAQKLAEARERAMQAELEKDVSDFFKKLTVENYTWRENMRKKMEHAQHGTDVRLVDLCLKYALGTPRKMEPVASDAGRMNFVDRKGLPWLPENDPMREQEEEALAGQAVQEKIDAAARQRKLSGAAAGPKDDYELVR
jgi:hypothetical protein